MEILTQGEKSTSPKRRVSSFFNEKKMKMTSQKETG